MSVALISYTSGRNWKGARKRIMRTKQNSIFLGGIHIFDEDWLISNNPDFQQHLNFLKNHKKGAGLWIWKPYLVKTFFDLFPNVNQIVYLDAGCELNLNSLSLKRLQFYLDSAKETGGVFFQLSQLESRYTSPELLALHKSEITRTSGQIMATCFVLQRKNQTLNLLAEWIQLSTYDDYHYLIGAKGESFTLGKTAIEHRHDQSILSLLVKRSQFTVLQDETYFYPHWRKYGKNFPFWSARNRHNISKTRGIGRFIHRSLLPVNRSKKFGYSILNRLKVVRSRKYWLF